MLLLEAWLPAVRADALARLSRGMDGRPLRARHMLVHMPVAVAAPMALVLLDICGGAGRQSSQEPLAFHADAQRER